jgi:hypothetical protein
LDASSLHKAAELFSINNQLEDPINPNDTSISGNIGYCNDSIDDEILKHMSPSHRLMLKIERLARERLNELLEPVRRGEMTLEELKRSRGLV